MRRTRQSGAEAAAIEAVAALADAHFVSRRWPELAAGPDAVRLAARLATLTIAEAPPINPLVDWGHLASLAGAGADEAALAVLADYWARALPAGVSPHPLLRASLYRWPAPPTGEGTARAGAAGAGAAWVRAALTDPDGDGRAFLPVLDPAFVLGSLGVQPDDLAGYGFRSVGRFYLAEAVRRGVPPCAVFDPVFVLAATGVRTGAGAADPAALLATALSSYLDAVERGEPPSPSPVFDEAFVRATQPAMVAALAAGAGSALEAWLAAGRPPVPRTASGLEIFPEAMPQPWWERERRAAARRGAHRPTPARLTAEGAERVRAADPPALAVRVTPHLPEAVFAGETVTLFADGFACSPGGDIGTVALCIGDDAVAREPFQSFPRAEAFARSTDIVDAAAQLFGGFAIAWTGPAPPPGQHAVTLQIGVVAREGGEVMRTLTLGVLDVRRRPPRRRPTAGTPAVAIAMATFEPDPDLFAAQVASIRAQTVTDWRLVVSDESVSEAGRSLVERLTRGDRRITVQHGPRRGVVGNFERALRAIDARAPFVALADQDDRWRPDKLERLAAGLTDGVALVHGAMRLVDAGGNPLPGAPATRRLFDPTLRDLLAENEVTGASALIRTSVIAAALPLPRLPGLFHDHWLALVARVQGRVVFEPDVVQDYVQHGGNVVGEDPRRDRAAAARLRRECQRFRRLVAGLRADEGAAPPPSAVERALLPAAFAVVPAAAMRLAAGDALACRRGAQGSLGQGSPDQAPPDQALAIGAAFGGRDPEAAGAESRGSGLSLARLAAFGTALGADAEVEPQGRLGVATWLAEGLAATAAVSARPGLAAAVAAIHHRRAAAAAR
jgi:hypothetical protein